MTEAAARNTWSYPETSATLLRTLREARSGVDDVAWARFVDMYGPVKFRTYLSMLTRRLLIDRYRSAAAHAQDRQVALEAAVGIAADDDPGEWMDAKWRVACRLAAERRVMEESAISDQSREVWRLVSTEGMSVKDAARRMGIPANTASKAKRRVEALISAVLRQYAQ